MRGELEDEVEPTVGALAGDLLIYQTLAFFCTLAVSCPHCIPTNFEKLKTSDTYLPSKNLEIQGQT